MRHILLTLAAIIAIGCDRSSTRHAPVVRDSAGIRIISNTSPTWAAGEAWRLSDRPIMQIGAEGDTRYELARITGVVRLSDGSIVIAMRRPHVVYRYDSTGTFLNVIGRAGQGPEEYAQPQTVLLMPGDSILVPDFRSSPIFDREGRIGRRVKLPLSPRARGESATLGPVPDFVFADGSIASQVQVYDFGPNLRVVGVPGTDSLEVLRHAGDGTVLTTFGVFDTYHATCGEMSCIPQIAGPDRVFAAGPDRLFTGNGATFEVRAYDLDGRLSQIVRVDRPGIPFTDDSLAARVERAVARTPEYAAETRNYFREATRRDTLPHFSELLPGSDGTLWVGEYAANGDPTRWQVFDREGVWLGGIDLPRGFVLEQVYADAILGRQRDADDVERVVLHRLIKDGSPPR